MDVCKVDDKRPRTARALLRDVEEDVHLLRAAPGIFARPGPLVVDARKNVGERLLCIRSSDEEIVVLPAEVVLQEIVVSTRRERELVARAVLHADLPERPPTAAPAVAVGEVHVPVPVVGREEVRPLAEMVRDAPFLLRLLRRGVRIRHKPFLPVQLPSWRGQLRRPPLAELSAPVVIRRGRHAEKARRDEREELVLVEVHRHLLPRVLSVVLAEPVREVLEYLLDALGLRKVDVIQLRAAASGVVGTRHREAPVKNSRQDRGLAAARVPYHAHVLRVNERLRLHPVEDARIAPGPCGERPPRFVVARAFRLHGREDPLREARALLVRRHDVEPERRGRVAARDDFLDRPEHRRKALLLVEGAALDVGRKDECRHGTLQRSRLWDVRREREGKGSVRPLVRHAHELAHRLAAKRLADVVYVE